MYSFYKHSSPIALEILAIAILVIMILFLLKEAFLLFRKKQLRLAIPLVLSILCSFLVFNIFLGINNVPKNEQIEAEFVSSETILSRNGKTAIVMGKFKLKDNKTVFLEIHQGKPIPEKVILYKN